MMKKYFKLFVVVLCMFFFLFEVDAKSLKQLKDQLAKDEAELKENINNQKNAQEKVKKYEKELGETARKIDKYEIEIQEAKEEIVELNKDIDEKEKEIDSLLSFLQVSDGDNVYLEYVFNAKDFTDFIYRSSIVEQLTEYNDELIDEMYDMIEENKKLQKNLNKKIDESESLIESLDKLLAKENLRIDDLNDDHKDIKADIKARKEEIKGYEDIYKANGCKDDVDISICLAGSTPTASGFVRPLVKASVTSNYGMRYHPTKHYYTMHYGIDLGASTGTKIYPVAPGTVSKIERVANPNKANSSCGGNKVYIRHIVNGKQYTSVYMHLHTVNVKINQVVMLDSVIGGVGGGEKYDYCTTGPHLHFGLMKGWSSTTYVNPRNYISLPAKGNRFTSRW